MENYIPIAEYTIVSFISENHWCAIYIVEPFRCIIDRKIRTAYNLGQIHAEDFEEYKGKWTLSYKNGS